MLLFSVIVSGCFALLMKPTDAERWRYFGRLLFYFVVCGVLVAWVMSLLPL
jgi:hypothetical protein